MYNISSTLIKDDEVQRVPNSSKITPLMDEKRWGIRRPSIDSSIDIPTPNTFVSSDRRYDVSERNLSKMWLILAKIALYILFDN